MPLQSPIASPNSRLAHHSTLIEKTLEYHLSGAVTGELLRRHHPSYPAQGAGAGWHQQAVTAHINLANKPSACVIWMTYDPKTLRPVSYRFFGGTPASPIPALGDKPARHSRGNRDGLKGKRPLYRVVPIKRFQRITEVTDLVDRLFGAAPDSER